MRAAVALASCLALISCLEPLQPTPVSTVISIQPASPFTRGFDSETISRFEIAIRLQNLGSRTIYVDASYQLIEKLIDQKWTLARESPPSPFVAFRAIPQGQRVTVSYVVLYNRATSPDNQLLEHIRGLYRMGVRLAYNANGTDPLSSGDSWSQPFAVTE